MITISYIFRLMHDSSRGSISNNNKQYISKAVNKWIKYTDLASEIGQQSLQVLQLVRERNYEGMFLSHMFEIAVGENICFILLA